MLHLPLPSKTAFLLLGSCWLGLAAGHAQQAFVPTARAVPAASVAPIPASFDFELAHIAQDAEETHTVFTLYATQPRDSKSVGQKIRISIVDTNPGGKYTRFINLNTGKHKTIAQLCATLRDIFRKYQTTPASATGTVVGKIGDIKYGGEVRFVAESIDRLRYDMQTEGDQDRSNRLTASEVASLVALLGEASPPATR